MLEQYRYASIINDTTPSVANKQLKDDCMELLDRFSELDEEIRLAAATSDAYKHDFFEDYTDEQIEEYAASLNPTTSKQVNDINRRMDDYLENYQLGVVETFGEAYLEYLRGAYQIGQIKGENYLAMAYSGTYGREYSVDDTDALKDLFNAYIVPIYTYTGNEYNTFIEAVQVQYNRGGGVEYDAYLEMEALTSGYYANYFDYVESYIKDYVGGEFYDNFRYYYLSGNYFYSSKTNNNVTGYVGRLNATDSIMFLGPKNQSVTTFIHEFGHYNAAREGGDNISYDLDEVHSQANELMFYNYLLGTDCKSERGLKEFFNFQLYQMFDNVISGYCINEVEKWAMALDLTTYADTYYADVAEYNEAFGTALTDAEFAALNDVDKIKGWKTEKFETDLIDKWVEICGTVGASRYVSMTDWLKLVLVNYNGYYISYSTSALGALEVFAKSLDDPEAALAGYKMLYKKHNPETDTFTSCLEDAGFYGVFDERCYQLIQKIYEYLTA